MQKKNTANALQQGKKRRFSMLPYLLLLPSLLLFAAFTYYPFAKTIVSSFAITTEAGKFVRWAGLSNWTRLFSSSSFWQILKNTILFAILNLVMTFFGAMVLALLSVNKGKGSRLYQTLYALPMAIASSPAAAIWLFILRQNAGVLNQILGTSNAWLRSPDTALFAVAVVTTWTHIASSYIYLLVGFRNVSEDLLEAATIDGAGKLVRVWKIMIPMASPQIFFVLFLNIVNSFKAFAQIRLLTSGGPGYSTTTLIYAVYKKAMLEGQFESACCMAIVLFVIIFIVTRIQFMLEKKMVHYN